MSECRCEAKRNRGVHCQLCMGRTCWNKTYKYKGEIFHLVNATLLWSTGRYDGPLSGIAAHKGLACFAKTYTMYRHRTFWLYPLRELEWKRELIHHSRWIQAKGDEFKYIKLPNREAYTKRKPLGFFRFNYNGEPWEINAIGSEFRERRYESLFDEWGV